MGKNDNPDANGSRLDRVGSGVIFAEPSWHTSLGPSPYYNDSHRRLQRTVRAFLEKEIFPMAMEWEDAGQVPDEVYKKFADQGLIIPSIPRKYRNGKDLPAGIVDDEWDDFHDLIITDEISRCPALGVIYSLSGGNTIGCTPIIKHGTEEQKLKYLPRVHCGEIRFCLAITEPGAGSDVANISTTAIPDPASPSHFLISGQKKWITTGLWADYATMAVRVGPQDRGAEGIALCIVPLKEGGVNKRRIRASGIVASGSTFLELDNV